MAFGDFNCSARTLAGDGPAFSEISEEWEKRYNAGDAAGVAALYSEDGTLMPPNREGSKGRTAIEADIKGDIGVVPGKLDIVVVSEESSGNIGWAMGTFTVKDGDGNVLDKGKWVEARTKIKGQWYIDGDIWNSDMPAS